MTDTTSQRTVLVSRNGQCLSIDDLDLLNLGDVTTARIASNNDHEHGYRTERRLDSLLRPSDGMMRPNAGLLPVLAHRAALAGLGLHVRLLGPSIATLPEPTADTRIADVTLPMFVRAQERGLIRVGRGVAIANLIAELNAAFPTARTVILGAHRNDLQRLDRDLQRLAAPAQLYVGRHAGAPTARIVLTTFIAAADAELAQADLVILVDADEAVQQRAQAALVTTDARFRLFGILAADRILAPYSRDVVIATFGPEVLNIPRHGFTLGKVSVAWCNVQTPKVAVDADPLELRRRGYWQHPTRNRRLANLAQAVFERDCMLLRPYPDVARWLRSATVPPSCIAVLVDTVEHAVALAEQLPGWPIAAGEHPCLHGLPARKRRLLAERRAMWFGQHQIVTSSAAQELRILPDVIVWAGGGPQCPALPDHWLQRRTGDNSQVLLVDCVDRHHRQLARWSRRRKLSYINADRFDVGITPATGRVIRFLWQGERSRHLAEGAATR